MSERPTPEHPTPEHIMQVGLGFWASKTLLSAVELGVHRARAGRRTSTASSSASGSTRSARDFLDALVALGFLEREDGVYRNTPDTDLFLDRGKASYLGNFLEMANHRLYGFWGGLSEGSTSGRLQGEAKTGEAPFFEAIYADPGRLRQFLAAMTGLSHPRTC